MCWERSEQGQDVTEPPSPAFSGRCGGTDGSMGGAKHGDWEEMRSSVGRRCWQLTLGVVVGLGSSSRLSLCFGGGGDGLDVGCG